MSLMSISKKCVCIIVPVLSFILLFLAGVPGLAAAENIDPVNADAQEKKSFDSEKSQLKIGGFFDVNAKDYKNDKNIFSIGSFELGLEKTMGDYFQVATALVFSEENSEPRAELAVGFIDFHVYGGTTAPRGKLFTQKGFHIQAGRFDIPFGNDWIYYPSKDREGITPPLTTDMAMNGGLNDVGVRVLGFHRSLNYTFYMIRGVGEGNSFGGRIGLTPFHNPFVLTAGDGITLELGGSIYYDLDWKGGADGWPARDETGWALDAEVKYGIFKVRGEYVRRDNTAGTAVYDIDDTLTAGDVTGYHLTVDGYHITACVFFDFIKNVPFSFYSRFDRFNHELKSYQKSGLSVPGENGDINRAAAGLNFSLFEAAVLKLEYLYCISWDHNLPAAADINAHNLFCQMVIKF